MLVTVFLLRDKKPADSGEPFNLQQSDQFEQCVLNDLYLNVMHSHSHKTVYEYMTIHAYIWPVHIKQIFCYQFRLLQKHKGNKLKCIWIFKEFENYTTNDLQVVIYVQ